MRLTIECNICGAEKDIDGPAEARNFADKHEFHMRKEG